MRWRNFLWSVASVVVSCGIVHARSPAPRFNGLDMHLGNLSRLSDARSRSISPENFTGAKGKGGMATEGTGKDAARDWAAPGRFRLRCASRPRARSPWRRSTDRARSSKFG